MLIGFALLVDALVHAEGQAGPLVGVQREVDHVAHQEVGPEHEEGEGVPLEQPRVVLPSRRRVLDVRLVEADEHGFHQSMEDVEDHRAARQGAVELLADDR